MLYKTRAIVLKNVKYGDSSLIVQIYTEDFGRQSLLVHGVRKKKSNFGYFFFEPLSLLNLDIYYKENRDLQTLKEAKPCIVLHHLLSDVKKSSIAIFISEVLFRCLREVESNKSLFNYLFHAIQILDVADEGLENFHIIFLLQLSKFLGIHPKNNTGLIHFKNINENQLNNLFEYSLQDISDLKIEKSVRLEFLNQLILYYKTHLEGMGEIKSLQVLHDVYF